MKDKLFKRHKTELSILYFSKMVCHVLFCSVLFCSVQYRRPNGYKIGTNTHWDYAMKIGGVSDRECASMCAQRHISSTGGQTAGPIEPQIGTNTHCENVQKLWRVGVRVARAIGAEQRECGVREAKKKITSCIITDRYMC
jgi:hypothetical protein